MAKGLPLVALLFAFLPVLLVAGLGAGVPPGESRLLYGVVLLLVNMVALLLIFANRVRLSSVTLQQHNRRVIKLAVCFVLLLAGYLWLYNFCVVAFPGRTTTFYPLWLTGEFAANVQATGGREAFLKEYASGQVRMLIAQYAGGPMLVTRILFVTVLAGVFVTAFILPALAAARLYAGRQTINRQVFFSYAWGGEREKLIDALYESLKNEKDFTLVRDKVNLQYKGLISEFIKNIGKGNFVIIAISDKYLRSEYCMHELYELYRNSNLDTAELLKKIYPLRVEDIDLNNPAVLQDYFTYWKNLEDHWRQLVNKHGADQQELRRVEAINFALRDLLPFLDNINSLTTSQLAREDFAAIKRSVRARFSELENS
ncbi:TIR domain-containing protein [Foetidibacter luteolus]|uniref:TIR domain-containing protein n=1 Tax=Foetidibacter luteolus TaxID=2608880 RepID=UPI00129A6302|nr:TIR domain-containing protein [Foetidibacter luteolus]